MPAAPEVLILEDDPEELAALTRAVRSARLEALGASSPGRALALLRHRRPLLAIIDLDMSKLPLADRRVGVREVLRTLRERHLNCIPLVYSAAVETIDEQARIYAAHPHCLFQSKRHGDGHLLERVDALLSARVGDLVIRAGMVIHLPSGQRFSHRVAVALLTARRAHRPLVLGESEARAARRFQGWLCRCGSSVRVQALGNRHYQLTLAVGEGEPSPQEAS